MHPATPAAFLALMALALFACCLRYCRRPRSIERQTMIGRAAARSDGRPRRATPPRRAHRLAGSGTGSGSSKQLFDTAFESALRSGGLGGWPKPLRIAQGQHQLQEQLQDRGSRGGADDHALIEISPYDNTSGVGVHRSDSVESRLSDEASSSASTVCSACPLTASGASAAGSSASSRSTRRAFAGSAALEIDTESFTLESWLVE
ncbi:hypothetical protein EMIHUDRAFT_237155 [Emiliania huxleyi CCMP1516]|uniref:Secreted protein n=2 Tax=Emiliania huxleyi TaxID=2903 RepID=A0A0D3JR84_EMIH1|nr:hypothetical protein EMIHUDRAFT_237155 [Emiliania huxleyi CCMP1516]EOD26019.1 hypothetical protein EMIHUDRAFT_237155 [Emiliania huxleyi CCMP1516]|eukprot:XP_005778448.1 hypothetical protein EMIHUDRAFT_237155 [Emiliania huxleyi CCMP1516]